MGIDKILEISLYMQCCKLVHCVCQPPTIKIKHLYKTYVMWIQMFSNCHHPPPHTVHTVSKAASSSEAISPFITVKVNYLNQNIPSFLLQFDPFFTVISASSRYDSLHWCLPVCVCDSCQGVWDLQCGSAYISKFVFIFSPQDKHTTVQW